MYAAKTTETSLKALLQGMHLFVFRSYHIAVDCIWKVEPVESLDATRKSIYEQWKWAITTNNERITTNNERISTNNCE